VTTLALPDFEMAPLPMKVIPAEVCEALFADEIKRLKKRNE